MNRFIMVMAMLAMVCVGCRGQKASSVDEIAAKAMEGSENVSLNYVTTPEDSTLAVSVMEKIRETGGTTAQRMVNAGTMLLGQPYVAGTLDEREEEKLGIFLTRTDCIIFVETCMNLALASRVDASFETFATLEQMSRYRNGVCREYSDRVHYTTEWIRQGESRGILKDITLDLGGEVYDDPIDFMSTHTGSYSHLKNADSDSVAANDLKVISEVEKTLNEVPFTYIPQEKIAACEDGIRSGDIVGLMSATEGLDIAHVVIAYVHYPDGTPVLGKSASEAFSETGTRPVVGFMHASMGAMKVIVDPKSINDYVNGRQSVTGIKVIRVN